MRKRFWIALLLCLPFSLALAKPSYIIDTDMGDDDLLAINYLLAESSIHIAGITVVGSGESHCSPGVKNALFLVGLGWPWNIPVSCGGQHSLSQTHAIPTNF